MLGDDSADDGQPQSRAAFAGGKIRVEDSFAVFGRDAGAGVGDDQLNALSLRDFARDDGDSAEPRHRRFRFRRSLNAAYAWGFALLANNSPSRSGRSRSRAE